MKHGLYPTGTDGQAKRSSLEYYFVRTGFIDLLPLALEIAGKLEFGKEEMIEAICKVADKCRDYPPVLNRRAWFAKVYKEKLFEARADILAYKKCWRYRENISL
ncbi:hypothetical protein IT084_15335 [Desulfallas sp. Bu1-1]|uniref:hypothetical protein n=1 Tax=Desulfallas sp. Bu1-1 TaxID=2787620 RepID=UPI0018A0CA10|nr:hypothetical protein [Desulfallas sp. Bu1-1]MBF7084326.1 hypothetical protein [Desulfallas sp. Bu1-1]